MLSLLLLLLDTLCLLTWHNHCLCCVLRIGLTRRSGPGCRNWPLKLFLPFFSRLRILTVQIEAILQHRLSALYAVTPHFITNDLLALSSMHNWYASNRTSQFQGNRISQYHSQPLHNARDGVLCFCNSHTLSSLKARPTKGRITDHAGKHEIRASDWETRHFVVWLYPLVTARHAFSLGEETEMGFRTRRLDEVEEFKQA